MTTHLEGFNHGISMTATEKLITILMGGMTTHIYNLHHFGNLVMKAPILAVAASLSIASVTAKAASANDCTQIIQNLKDSASTISQNAHAYWKHRHNFIDLKFDQAGGIEPDILTLAEREKTQGETQRTAMPNSVANFKKLVAMAKTQNCLISRRFEVIIEETTKLAKGVNFDQLPEEKVSTETSNDSGAPRMPLE